MEKLRNIFERPAVCRCVQAFAAACVAFTLFGMGFAMCCTPLTTNVLSNATSNFAYSPFPDQTLVNLAEATRAYTVEGMDYADYCAIEREALDELIASNRLVPAAQQSLEAIAAASTSDVEMAEAAAEFHVTLALDKESVSHLDDVHAVVFPALFAVLAGLVLAIASLAHLVFYNGRKAAGQALITGVVAIVAILLAFLAWALADFNSLFSWMHGLFFAAGTWTFSYESLLICMYPEGFWIGMGVTWILTTFIAGGIALALGIRMTRKN